MKYDFDKLLSRAYDYLFEYYSCQNEFVKTDKKATSDNKVVIKGDYAYYDDLDYNNQNVTDNWAPTLHLSRTRDMLLNNYNEENISIAVKLLNYRLSIKAENSNWWHNEIGTPQIMLECCFLLWKHLNDRQREDAVLLIRPGSIKYNSKIGTWEGANLMWGAANTVGLAVLEQDAVSLESGLQQIEKECSFHLGKEEDGIRKDFSFFQHGNLLYNYGYGRSFAKTLTEVFYIMSGSKSPIFSKAFDIFESYLLFGCRHMQYRGYCDYLTCGREVSRYNALDLSEFAVSVSLLCNLDECKRKGDMQKFLSEICGEDACSFIGNYPESLFTVSATKRVYCSVKGSNKSHFGTEVCNGENFMADALFDGGQVCFMSYGNEYANLAPVWDYAMLPGTTCEYLDRNSWFNRFFSRDWIRRYGANDSLCTAKINSLYATGFHLQREYADALVSRTVFSGGMLLAGSKISGERYPVRSTVDQCRRYDNCTVPVKAEVLLKKHEYICNGNFRYTNLCDVPLHAKAEIRTGSWDYNNDEAKHLPKATETVLTLWYEHNSSDNYYAALVSDSNMDIKADAIFKNDLQTVIVNGDTVTFDFSKDGKCVIG